MNKSSNEHDVAWFIKMQQCFYQQSQSSATTKALNPQIAGEHKTPPNRLNKIFFAPEEFSKENSSTTFSMSLPLRK